MNTTINNSIRRRSVKTKSLATSLLMSNYAFAIYFSGWRKEYYLPRAISITCFQTFFIVASAFYLVYPRLRNQGDLYYFFPLLGTIAFILLYYQRDVILKHFMKREIHKKYPDEEKQDFSRLFFSVLLTTVSFVIFFSLSLFKIYAYHTRFFWWNNW